MNAGDFVRPIRSLQRFRLRDRGLPSSISPAALLAEIMKVDQSRCAANVLVFGGRTPAVNDFADAALTSLGPLDSLWRVGHAAPAAGQVFWVATGDPLLRVLNARVAFIPADDDHKHLFGEWHRRADGIFVGPGRHQDAFAEFDPEQMWQWNVPVAERPAKSDHGHPIPGRVTEQPVALGHGLMTPTAGEETSSEFAIESWSKNRDVRATLRGGSGGQLILTFSAIDLTLEGSTVNFRLSTGDGSEIKGSVVLWPVEIGVGLAAFWMGSQLDFRRPTPTAQPAPSGGLITLEFELVPRE